MKSFLGKEKKNHTSFLKYDFDPISLAITLSSICFCSKFLIENKERNEDKEQKVDTSEESLSKNREL